MKFQHGNSGKPIGAINKTTKEMRELISNLINNELQIIEQYKSELTAKEWLEVLIRLMPYSIPKAAPMITNEEKKEPQIFNIHIIKGDEQEEN
jgi:hypothetical protein